jgi:hypothetical protein
VAKAGAVDAGMMTINVTSETTAVNNNVLARQSKRETLLDFMHCSSYVGGSKIVGY